MVDCFWNVMAHAQKPDFVFPLNGRVHLNRWGRQFSRLLAAEVCASAVVMLDTPRPEIVWEYWLPTPFASFPFNSRPVRHRVPSHFSWTLPWYAQCLSYASTVSSLGGTATYLLTTGQFYLLFFRNSYTSIFSVLQEIPISNYGYDCEMWIK